jgi:hypothetical protein
VLVALIVAFFAAAFIAGAAENTSLPTCHDVNRGEAAPDPSGDCFDGSETRAIGALVLAILGGIGAVAGLVLSVMLAAGGRHGRLFLIACGAAVVCLLLAIAVINLF